MSRRIFRSVTAVLGAANIIILACKCYAGTPADWGVWLWAFLGAAGFTLDQIERVSDEHATRQDPKGLGSEGLPARPDAGGGRPS